MSHWRIYCCVQPSDLTSLSMEQAVSSPGIVICQLPGSYVSEDASAGVVCALVWACTSLGGDYPRLSCPRRGCVCASLWSEDRSSYLFLRSAQLCARTGKARVAADLCQHLRRAVRLSRQECLFSRCTVA